MAKHREWMETQRAKEAYRRRSELAEFPNAWVEGAVWGEEVSGAGVAEGAIGVTVGDVGVQREGLDPAGVAAA